MEPSGIHIALFPFPIPGHIIPLLDLAVWLASDRHKLDVNIKVTVILTEANINRKWPQLQGLNLYKNCCFSIVPISDGLPVDFDRNRYYSRFFDSVQRMGPALRTVLQQMEPPASCLISDPHFPWLQQIADMLKLPLFPLITDSATCFAVNLQGRKLLELGFIGAGRKKDPSLTVDFIKGVEPFPAKLLGFPPQEELDSFFNLRLSMYDRIGDAAGVLLNTGNELEKKVIEGIKDTIKIRVFPVGPLGFAHHSRASSLTQLDSNVMLWLDKQQENSVMYICFGSLVTPTDEDIKEIAAGLLASGRPFLWCVKAAETAEKYLREAIATHGGEACSHLVVKWVSQFEVLGHPAVGGFFSHCGWNSVMEAVTNGVPMLCYGLFLDQPLNSRIVCESWKLGLTVDRPLRGSNIATLVCHLLDHQPRNESLRSSIVDALSPNGSSSSNLYSFIQTLRNNSFTL